MEKKNLEKIYEKFLEEVEPTEEMKLIYDELSNKILEIKSSLTKELVNEIEVLEELFSKINDLEMKAAFYKGFSVATNILLEAKES